MNETKNPRDTDLDRLIRLKALSWLSAAELTMLAGVLALANFKRSEIILREAAFSADAHILLTGIARITCRNARSERVTVALLPPGPIPEFPSLPLSRSNIAIVFVPSGVRGAFRWHRLPPKSSFLVVVPQYLICAGTETWELAGTARLVADEFEAAAPARTGVMNAGASLH